MTPFILIIMVVYGKVPADGGGVTSAVDMQEFTSRESCVSAADEIMKTWKDSVVYVNCVAK